MRAAAPAMPGRRAGTRFSGAREEDDVLSTKIS